MGEGRNNEFSLEDILEEERRRREQPQAEEELSSVEEASPVSEPDAMPSLEPAQQEVEEAEDLNAFATGNLTLPKDEQSWEDSEDLGGREQSFPEEFPVEETEKEQDKGKKKKKKKKGGWFGRKKRAPDFDEGEDMYYGIQLKPIDEYRMGFDGATGEFTLKEDSFKSLFDDSKKAIDDEVEANFQRLQKERRRRVAEAVQTAGMDESQIADEFGIVAPMPVTAFAADPYAKQHGIAVEGAKASGEGLPEIQKAMLETSSEKTMEIKLNVLNDTVELQRTQDMPAVSEGAVHKILEASQEQAPGAEAFPPEEKIPVEEVDPANERTPVEEEASMEEPASMEEIPAETPPKSVQDGPVLRVISREEEAPVEQPEPVRAAEVLGPGEKPEMETQVISGRPVKEIPRVASIYEYRPRGIPTHVVNADILQSALLTESEELQRKAELEEGRRSSRKRNAARRKEEDLAQAQMSDMPEEDTGEAIDDYTGPEDAKSISRELKGDMQELTLRMLITGVCTVLLAIVNMIFGGSFAATPVGEWGSAPMVYLVLTLVFFLVSVGICYRTIGNGLKALFAFNANSDSAAAVAAVAALAQTVCALFFASDLAEGKLHLYAVVVSAILFVNAAGKQTMLRRIHSNFRFVSSKEQKYSVRLFDDYNTALKMTKDCVAEKPVLSYQCKTGFLKRFLEFSYNPDPAEAASQFLAPIGLIASLVLCIASLLITRSVPVALSALAAAACACVAVGNMLAINLPVSRLCKTARRAGAMIVGYEGVEELGNVNAVLVDAGEIFPLGTVVLNGIKTFGNRQGAEEAIMAASALMKEVGGPLSGVFEQVISENEDSLPEVEGVSYEDGNGIVGYVDGKRVYIGNRSLLMNHRLEAPAREEENQYVSGNKQVVYLAVDTRVCAMMILTYSADRRKKNELQRLEDNGVSIVVRTTDMNVTPQLLSRLFGIDTASVCVLGSQLGEVGKQLMEEEIPRADAKVATKGRMESLLSVVSACVGERRNVGLIVALQSAAVILGFVVVAFLACFGGMKQLTSFVLFTFQLFWLLIILIIPKLRKR